jgi:hypothetical protein
MTIKERLSTIETEIRYIKKMLYILFTLISGGIGAIKFL